MTVVFLVPIFIVVFFAWQYWRWTRTSLTRDCRWREDRPRGEWVCASCGGRRPDDGRAPRVCLRR
jgi:hypothetical protein